MLDLRLRRERLASAVGGRALGVDGAGEVSRRLCPFERKTVGCLRVGLVAGGAQARCPLDRAPGVGERLGERPRRVRSTFELVDDLARRRAIIGEGASWRREAEAQAQATCGEENCRAAAHGRTAREHPLRLPWQRAVVNLAVGPWPGSLARCRPGLCPRGVRRKENALTMDTSAKPGRVRASWDDYFMNIAKEVSSRSTCDRKFVGAVIVRDKSILATGYNGSIRGLSHCDEDGHLMEDGHCVRTVHAEANAIVQAARNGVRIDGSSIYVTASPCWGCFRLIANAGIARVAFGEFYRDPRIFEVAVKLGITLVDMSKAPAAAGGT